MPEKLSELSQKILNLIESEEPLSLDKICNSLREDGSEKEIKGEIKVLFREGLISRGLVCGVVDLVKTGD